MQFSVKKSRLKPLNYILIKPAGSSCNLACTYCFYHDSEKNRNITGTRRMESSVLREMIKQCLSAADERFVFCWQGGEPTLAGLGFYREVIELQKEYGRGKIIGNAIQTNGVLIDAEWAAFLKKYRFMAGLSIDGPEEIHNKYRMTAGGEGAWKHADRAAGILLSEGVAVNSMTVVNDVTAEYPDRIYKYLKDLGFRWMQFMPCLESGNTEGRDTTAFPAPFSVEPGAYGRFLCRLFDLWYDDFSGGRAEVSIRFFDSVAASYAGLPASECTNRFECGEYVVVEADGSVYSCDFFVEDRWRLGNLTEAPLDKLLNSKLQQHFGGLKSDLPADCRACGWLKYCRGGCIKDRSRVKTPDGTNYFCPAYRMFFEHADERFREITARFRG